VIRRKVAVAIQISALLRSGCLGFAVATAAAGAWQARDHGHDPVREPDIRPKASRMVATKLP
jgi:hypothetical protein